LQPTATLQQFDERLARLHHRRISYHPLPFFLPGIAVSYPAETT
jgi:hypothetical protein